MRFRNLLLIIVASSLLFITACGGDKEEEASTSGDNLENLKESGMPIVEETIEI